jgi:DNA-3-methyladenine glycosylase II
MVVTVARPAEGGPRVEFALPDRCTRALTPTLLRQGVRALVARDNDLARAFSRTGFSPLWGRRPGFSTLVRIILEQQVSLGAARAMYARLGACTGGVTARAIARLGEDGLRSQGFTRQKAAYCHGLAERVLDGRIDLGVVRRRGPGDADGGSGTRPVERGHLLLCLGGAALPNGAHGV